MRRGVLLSLMLILSGVTATLQEAGSPRAALVARAKLLELNTAYEPVPGDPLQHHAGGFAKIMCSAVFVSGLDPDFAAENLGYFTAPYEARASLGKPAIDRTAKQVTVTLPDGMKRVARYVGSQGCVTLPMRRSESSASSVGTLSFTPVAVKSALPDPNTQPWPMGDLPSKDPVPPGVDVAKVRQAVDAAFEPAESMTAAVVVTWRGHIVGERYGEHITARTPLESWSMGKSLTATLMGVLIKQGAYTLDQPAPIPEWQKTPGDPRAKITIRNILNMSSGLRIRAPQDPDYDPAIGYPDHLFYYTGDNAFRWAATRPQQWPPDTVGRYRNTDPVLINYLVRMALEKRNESYYAFPHRALFDKIGVRNMVMDVDPAGNFLTQGYELGAARDWARIANLYLNDGMANGERILPEGYATFVRTLAPAWAADKRPTYGGFFWINGDRSFPVPADAFYMAGVGGQNTLIIPSHDLVVVRLGHYKGASVGGKSLRRALTMMMEAVPAKK